MELRVVMVEVQFGDLMVDWKQEKVKVQDQLSRDLGCKVKQRNKFLERLIFCRAKSFKTSQSKRNFHL